LLLCVVLVGASATELVGRVEGLGTTARVTGSNDTVATTLGGGVIEVATTAEVASAPGLLTSTAGGALTRDDGARTTGLLSVLVDGLTTATLSGRGAFEGVGTTALRIGEVGAIEEVSADTTELVGVVKDLGATACRIGEIGGLEELLVTADLLEWVEGLAIAALGLEWTSLHHISGATRLGVGVQGTRFLIVVVIAAGLRATGDNRV
jgi:hypothetical protein